MIVLDASALIEVLLQTDSGQHIGTWLLAEGQALHAPHLVDVEVTQVLRRLAARGEIGDERGRLATVALMDFPLQRHPHEVLLPRVWMLRHNLTAYDAVYVALAEGLDATLLTRDKRLAQSSGHRARIDLV